MDEGKVVYWCLVVGLAAVLLAGTWIGLFGDRILQERARLAEARLGKRGVEFFVMVLRLLAFAAAGLSLYILVILWRLLPCAMR
jgi:hypothetical protein